MYAVRSGSQSLSHFSSRIGQTTPAKGRSSLKDKLDSQVAAIGQETAKEGSVA